MSVIIKNTNYTGKLTFDNYPFPLSEFQKHSIQAWTDNKNVLITAHTGSGKTLPAEYAINNIVTNNLGKVIYASPIKSLSNDKYNDLRKKFPDADIGIITGDIKFNPTGNVLIMTTEILRNLLYNKKIEDIRNKITIEININEIHTVIFDEVHYINDVSRGHVWEECFIKLPSSIRLINLSATIDNPEHFCKWLATIKKKDIVHTYTVNRVVPLRHGIFLDYLPSYLKKKEGESSIQYNNKPIIFSDEHNKFNSELYSKTLLHIKRSQIGLSRQQVINNLIYYLDTNKLHPAIFFSFSRKYCEKLAGFVTSNLLKGTEASIINKIIDKNLRKTENFEKYTSMRQFIQLKKCLMKGVAFHHSGLLPVFKEIIEILFANKDKDGKPAPLVKVLFATETFAVGVNMPTKTVIFTGLEKYTDGSKRYLLSHEFLQMAGRAGRRGIDKSGLVLLLPNMNPLPDLHKMSGLLLGKSQIVKSKFTTNYKIILQSIKQDIKIKQITDNSLISKEVNDYNKVVESELKEITDKCPTISVTDLEEINEYNRIKSNDYGFIKPSKKKIKLNKIKLTKMSKDPEFMKKYNFYLKNKNIIDKKNKLEEEVNNNNYYMENQVESVKSILTKEGYLTIDKSGDTPIMGLSIKGILACEINECNELLLTEVITNDYLDEFNYRELGTILSIFGSSRKLNQNNNNRNNRNNRNKYDQYRERKQSLSLSKKYNKILGFIYSTSKRIRGEEYYYGLYLNTEWDINTDCMDATNEWLDGGDFNTICSEHDLYEGNVIRDFIKIYNLAACIKNIATIVKKHTLSNEASKLMEKVMRDVVTVESLYIN